MVAIKASDVTLLTPSDYSKVRMELFELDGTGKYKVRYEAAQAFLQRAANIAIGDAALEFNTLGKIQPMIEALQNAGVIANALEFDVVNGTDAIIPRGTVVYPDAGTGIGLADAYYKAKSRVIAVVKDDIAIGGAGSVVKYGRVINVDTSDFVTGQLIYLGSNGGFSTTHPDDGGYVCIVGVVEVVSATEGSITVDTAVSPTTVETTDVNGFPEDQRAGTTLSFSNITRGLTITPNIAKFHYYMIGDKHEQTTAKTRIIDNVSGVHIVYFDEDSLLSITNPTNAQVRTIIMTKAIVALVYWNATSQKAVIVQDERHGLMQPIVHAYLHRRFGADYLSGLALENIVIGAGTSNTHAQYGIALGSIVDEDIDHDLIAVASTVGLPILYRDGAAGIFDLFTNAGYSFTVGANNRPHINFFNGTVWVRTEVTSGNFFNVHNFACGSIDKKPFAIPGTAQYTTAALASAGQATELQSILGNLPLPEFVLTSSVLFEVKDSFTNAVNARIVQNVDGDDYTNWTNTTVASGAPPSSHDQLAHLFEAGIGVQWGHVNSALYAKIVANELHFALSDETSALTTDKNDGQIQVSRAQTITSITFYVNVAPTGSAIVVAVKKNGATIATITLPISSTTVTINTGISDTSLAIGDRINADITQIGATVKGAGAKIIINTTL